MPPRLVNRMEVVGEQGSAAVVDLMPPARVGRGQRCGNHEQGEQARGQVDVEYPAPRQVIDEKATKQRADDGGKTERGSEKSLVSPAFARGNEVPDHSNGSDDQPTAADPLQRPKQNELDYILGQPAQSEAQQEQYDRCLQDDFAAMGISELSVERTGDGAGQQVGSHDPGQMGEAPELADDGRQGGGHDGLVERRE